MRQISALFCCITCVLVCLFRETIANVEKEIFLGPALPKGVVNNTLPRLAPSEHCGNCWAIRTRLSTSFVGKGEEHWIQINGLKEGRRYEVRVCWMATQPTDFTLDLYTPDQVLGDSSLLEKVQEYPSDSHLVQIEGSTLYLRVFAKTAYVSSLRYRMENPEPVDVDIILDPYLFNVAPESLLKIAGLITVVAAFSWWLGGWVHRTLLISVSPAMSEVKKNI